jgi:hypothetical protein
VTPEERAKSAIAAYDDACLGLTAGEIFYLRLRVADAIRAAVAEVRERCLDVCKAVEQEFRDEDNIGAGLRTAITIRHRISHA